MHHTETCEVHDECEIRDSYNTLDAAVLAITNEINAPAYTPVGYPINIIQGTINDDNLMLGPCWIIKDSLNYTYFIVKRTLH
jgi:hypothetical protein